MRWIRWVVGFAISLGLAGVARAEPVARTAQRGPAKTAPETESYAGSIATADGVTLGLLTVTAIAQAPEFAFVGIGTYLLVPPIIHGAKGNGGGAVLSLVSRLGIPLLTGMTAFELVREPRCPLPDEDPDEWRCDRQAEYLALGVSLGVLTAMVLDVAVLARRPVPKKQEAYVVVPNASWSKERGWALGVQGRF